MDGLPPVMACASGAWIWTMSHCRPDRLSEVARRCAVRERCGGIGGIQIVAELRAISGGRHGALDAAVLGQVGAEGGVSGAGDDHPDLFIVIDQ